MTAKLAQVAVGRAISERFDRPTPYTQKSTFIKPATKQNLQAMVFIKDTSIGGKNNYSLADILKQQFGGGTRLKKRIESAFMRAGLIGANEFLAPGSGAKLDAYGNLSKGQTQQIMSQLRVSFDPASYKSNSSRSKRNVKMAGQMFWSRGGKLPRGVWMRDGRSVHPILMVISQPNYRQRIDMNKIVQGVVDSRFDNEFQKSLEAALR